MKQQTTFACLIGLSVLLSVCAQPISKPRCAVGSPCEDKCTQATCGATCNTLTKRFCATSYCPTCKWAGWCDQTCGFCKKASNSSKVLHFNDGQHDRCISVIWPPLPPPAEEAMKSEQPLRQHQKPYPVLFWFHGHSGSAANCAENPLAAIAQKNGFALVCGEALQHGSAGGSWVMPGVINDETGTPCNDTDSIDITYIKKAKEQLAGMGLFDLTRIFHSGCSQGSGFSTYISTCTKQDPSTRAHISAFATHSTGLKIKGDGIKWDCCSNIDSCTNGCKYFPAKPFKAPDRLGLKACIFDNYQDRLPPDDSKPAFFYLSSKELATHWKSLGNKVETHFAPGHHCQIHNYTEIVRCLDDGTGRLLQA